ncbi:hypothetical protein NDU88_003290 [Pleurodeles waltl]|uniref:Uncharacterized protein n=1 Tax=Pleurodeles waltl TaxID=8319 RepID=A0AAV7W6G6_PLEWA|nr:hypothetical protein NDU88_003290 [Pleurodeles waltl]
MLVGSVLPLRQRSIGDREEERGQAASRPVAGSGSRRCAAVKAQRLRGGRSPRVTDVGRSSSPAPMSAPAALGGPSEHPQRHRRVARRRAELCSQAAIMDRGQTTPPGSKLLT